MSLFLNLLFEQIANSNEYFLAKFGVDTVENEPLKFDHLAENQSKVRYRTFQLRPAGPKGT